ncbi:flagellar type III secretion system pore protein FliP [bacterium]|nr:flagellar type III secretion system pore protein FliP [bacterium]
MKRKSFTTLMIIAALALTGVLFAAQAHAQSMMPSINLSIGSGTKGGTETATAMKIFIFMTLLTVAPALILTMTCFTRVVIVLSFIRQAIGVHQTPPNQVIIGLSLFLSFFIMGPVFKDINENAIKPFFADQISQDDAFAKASMPLKAFMLKQTHKNDLQMMLKVAKPEEMPTTLETMPLSILVPSFILSEMKTAFEIGFLIYLPFVLIDMVVSMVLLTMGMMVLPPVVISLPFKLMLFVLVDGWNLIVGSLVSSFK